MAPRKASRPAAAGTAREPRGDLPGGLIAEATTASTPLRQIETEAVPGFVGYDERGRFVHFCHCGRWGDFGFGYFPRRGQLGRWFCRSHRPASLGGVPDERLSITRETTPYDAATDFSESINDCYRAIRARKAAGGQGWTPP